MSRLSLPVISFPTFSDYRCIICHVPCKQEPSFCSGCLAILPWINPDLCLRCGSLGGNPCGTCALLNEPFQHRLAVFEYAFPLDALLKSFKYQEKRAIGRSLGLLLGQTVKACGLAETVDYLLPVPLAVPRRRDRGFNQAADIVEACSEVLQMPWSDRCLRRQADTPRLSGLNPVERRFALLGAFAASSEVAGKHVVLIDDVMTSGATSLEIHRELMDRGARAVSVWTLARTVQPVEAEEG